jgi:hypothetical protein
MTAQFNRALALLRLLLRVGDFQLETKVEAPVRKQFEFEQTPRDCRSTETHSNGDKASPKPSQYPIGSW